MSPIQEGIDARKIYIIVLLRKRCLRYVLEEIGIGIVPEAVLILNPVEESLITVESVSVNLFTEIVLLPDEQL